MREFKGRVRFGTEKVIGFPRLAVIFKSAPSPDSCVNGEAGLGALPRFFGLEQC